MALKKSLAHIARVAATVSDVGDTNEDLLIRECDRINAADGALKVDSDDDDDALSPQFVLPSDDTHDNPSCTVYAVRTSGTGRRRGERSDSIAFASTGVVDGDPQPVDVLEASHMRRVPSETASSQKYRALNFHPPCERRQGALLLPSYRELLDEHVALASSHSSSSPLGGAGSYAVPSAVAGGAEIPRNVVAPLLLRVSADPMVSSVVMRTFYTVLGDTILSTDPSCPSASGPIGVSLPQFRELGRSCSSLAIGQSRDRAQRDGSSAEKTMLSAFRQPVVTAVFECAAKPLQFLSLSSYIVALSLLSLIASPIEASLTCNPATLADAIMESLTALCVTLSRYLQLELPVWADPSVELVWVDADARRTVLEYSTITGELFDIFSVSPEEEISAALRRSSSLSASRPSSGSVSALTRPVVVASRLRSSVVAHPPPAKSDNDDGARSRNPRATGVTFADTERRTSVLPAARKGSIASTELSPATPATFAAAEALTPIEKLVHLGFPFVPVDDPAYYSRGCQYQRIMSLASVQRIVAAMSLPNVQPVDVVRAAKAASLMYRKHPFRMVRERAEAATAKKATPPASVALSAGLHPLARFVPSGEIFILECEFVDVLLRLSLAAFPELVTAGGGVQLRAIRRDTTSGRRASVRPLPDINDDNGLTEEWDAAGSADSVVQAIATAHRQAVQIKFSAALQKLMLTYVEGFYVSSTGNSVESKKQVVVSQSESLHSQSSLARLLSTSPRKNLSRGGEYAAFSEELAESSSSFALALPTVKEIAVTDTTHEVSFMRSAQEREGIAGWDKRRGVLIGECGGTAVAQGHLMMDLTGFYVLFADRIAVRATTVLSSAARSGKNTAVDDVISSVTMAEFQVPPLHKMFSQHFIDTRLLVHRAVTCCREGPRSLRIYPVTLVSVTLRFSNDGSSWTAVQKAAGRGSSSQDAGRLVMKQSRPTREVPPGLLEALSTIFSVYAQYQEVVREKVITAGKWRHLCHCLFYVVQNTEGNTSAPSCEFTEGHATAGSRHRSSAFGERHRGTISWFDSVSADDAELARMAASGVGDDESLEGSSSNPSGGADCLCASCRINKIISWKRTQEALSLTADDPKKTCSNLKRLFYPKMHVPIVTPGNISDAFERHCETRRVHWFSNSTTREDPTYKALSLERMVAALVDILINDNTHYNSEPLDARRTERVMDAHEWWWTLQGCVALECRRRQLRVPDASFEVLSISDLSANAHWQLAFRRQWAVTDSGIPLVADPGDSVAQRALSGVCQELATAQSATRRVFVFSCGVCVAEVVDRHDHLFWDHSSDACILRNRFVSVRVFDPCHAASFQRLLSIDAGFAATVQRLFKSHFLPFVTSREGLVETAAISGCRLGSAGGRRQTVAASSRRFWLLVSGSTKEVVGCLSNIQGQCGTLTWTPDVGSFESPIASLFLLEDHPTLSTESLLIFKLFLSTSAAVSCECTDVKSANLKWITAERRFRDSLGQTCGLLLEPVFL